MGRSLLRASQIRDEDNLSEYEHDVEVHENLVTSGTLNFQDGTISGTGDVYCDDVHVLGDTAHVGDGQIRSTDGNIELLDNGDKKLETTGSGIEVTGDVYATTYYGDGSNLTGITASGSDPESLYYNGTDIKATAISGGINFTDGTSNGNLHFDDTGVMYLDSNLNSGLVHLRGKASLDISSGVYTDNGFQSNTAVNSLSLKSDGTIYVISQTDGDVMEYGMTDFDVSTSSLNSTDTFIEITWLKCHTISDDGLKMYILDGSGTYGTIYQYTLSTAWDVSTASYDSKSILMITPNGIINDMRISPDGTKFFMCTSNGGGGNASKIFQNTLSTPFDITTFTYDSVNLYFGAETTNGYAFDFTESGKTVLVGGADEAVYQYSLPIAYTLTSGTYTGNSISADVEVTVLGGIAAGNNTLIVGDQSAKGIYEYDISPATSTLFVGDPAGADELYYAGDKTVETTDEGIEVIGGVKFPATQNASSDVNTLDDYDEYTAANTACTGALTVSAIWKLVKVGNLVTLTLPAVNGTTTDVAAITFGVSVPTKYRPTASIAGAAHVWVNGAGLAGLGVVTITTGGVISVYRDGSQSLGWGTAANSGMLTGVSVSWVI